MKVNSITFTKNEFLKLISIISNQNLYYINLNEEFTSSFHKMRSYFSDAKIFGISDKFISLMNNSLDSYEVEGDEDEVKNLRNYLEKNNNEIIDEIVEFIKRQSKTTTNEISKIKNFLLNLNKWNNLETDQLNNSVFTNYSYYMKNLIDLFMKTIPKSILTKTNHKLNCPAYWKLSKKHVKDLEKVS